MHVIGISETWLSRVVNDTVIGLEKYKIYRCDRDRHGGGVAIYIKKSLKSKLVGISSGSSGVEFVFSEISFPTGKVLIGFIYKPPGVNDLDEVHMFLSSIGHSYSCIVLGGDLNCDLISGRNTSVLLDFVSSNGLNVVNKTYPTHFSHTSASLLDIFLTSDSSKVLYFDQISFPAFSLHDLIFLAYDIKISDAPCVAYSYRDFSSLNFELLLAEANVLGWMQIYNAPSVDLKVELLNSFIMYLFHKYVPLKEVTGASSSCPWFNNYIMNLITLRNKAFARWKRFKVPELWDNYKKLRNKVSVAIRNSKRKYYGSKINTNLPSGTLWRNLRKIGLSKTSSGPNEDIDLNDLNSVFLSHSTNTHIDDFPLLSSHVSRKTSFNFRSVSYDEVRNMLFKVKSSAVGVDHIHPRFVKLLSCIILPFLTHIFNAAIVQTVFPSSWKFARVTPIPKSSNPSITDYRPISILPFLSKVFEKLLEVQIREYLLLHNFLCEFQSGFRPKHSCTTALLKISEDIRSALNSDEVTFLVLLDMTKAFDSINHNYLLHKLLSNFNFSINAIALLKSYLSDRFQQVCSGKRSSSFLPLHSGVPQGSILGPLLFSIFINDLPRNLLHCKYHLYADDLQIYISRRIGLCEDGIVRINEDLHKIQQWTTANGLVINAKKSKAITCYRYSLDTTDFPPILLGSDVIPFYDKVINLGVTFNKELTWSDHVDLVIRKIYAALHSISVSAAFLSQPVRFRLAQALILPIISYACEVYGFLDSNSSRRLNVAFNSIIRFIYRLKPFDHVSPYSNRLLGCSLQSYLRYRALLFLKKILMGMVAGYLKNLVAYAQSSRSLSIITPKLNFAASERHFFIQAIRLWNNLPLHLRRQYGSSNFNTILFQYISDKNTHTR